MNLSAFEFHGSNGVIVKSYGTLVTDITQLSSCTSVFQIRKDKWDQLPDIGSRHPIFTYIGMSKRSLEFQGLFAVATCGYEGAKITNSFGTPPVYELAAGVSEEPIETHPDFAKFAGSATNPLNGAQFRNVQDGSIANASAKASTDDGYVFDSFSVYVGNDKNEFAGIQSYLDSGCMTFRKTWNVPLPPTALGNIGKIDFPDGPAPQLQGGATWLNIGVTSTQRGSVYQAVQEWRASGRRGWNRDVYARD